MRSRRLKGKYVVTAIVWSALWIVLALLSLVAGALWPGSIHGAFPLIFAAVGIAGAAVIIGLAIWKR